MTEAQRKALQKYHKSEKGKVARSRAVKKYQSGKGFTSVRNAIKKYLGTDKGRKASQTTKRRYEFKKKGLDVSLTSADWEQILIDFDNKCAYCGSQEKLCQEHFIPVSKGGGYTKRNILPACLSCNNKKRNKHPADWLPAETYRRIANYLGI